MKLESPIKEQYKLLHHNPKQVARYIFQLLRAKLRGDMYGEERAVKELSRVIGESNVLANMLGRRRLLLEYNQFKKHWQPYRKAFLFGATPVIPSKTFDEALATMQRLMQRWCTGQTPPQPSQREGFKWQKTLSLLR